MKKVIILATLLITTVFLGGCGFNQQTVQTITPTTTTQQPNVESNNVEIQNFAFSPEILTVKKNTTVTWMNKDSVPHQINSDTFNSENLTNGQSFSFTFNEAGSFDYFCSLHPSMKGKIIVQ